MPDVVKGRIDNAGLLTAAGAPLLELQRQAGGSLGSELAVPSLAGIVRLARTLGILISRSVICASGDSDLELLVRARPDSEGVELSIGGWMPRATRQPWLAEQEEPLPVSEHTGTWTWATNAGLEIVETSGSAEHDLRGRKLTQVFRLIENAFDTMPILDALAVRSDFTDQRATMRTSPDQEVSLSGRIICDPHGNFAGFRGITDTTWSSSSAEVLVLEPLVDSAFTEKLDAALRVPLSRIVASADSISAQTDGPLRRDYADYAGDIASAARHLLALVDDLSDLQAVEQPDFRVDTEEVDLADLARRAAGLLKVRASDQKIRIDSPGNSEVLLAMGDYRQVLQILVNLIGNAIRYSPHDGMIWIRIEKDAESAVLVVADQGKGIKESDQARIFEKFERVDPSEPGGSGLGLFISRRLAQAMGGDITVDSAPGQGARFVLTLPAA